jgi:hypothetical protein
MMGVQLLDHGGLKMLHRKGSERILEECAAASGVDACGSGVQASFALSTAAGIARWFPGSELVSARQTARRS